MSYVSFSGGGVGHAPLYTTLNTLSLCDSIMDDYLTAIN